MLDIDNKHDKDDEGGEMKQIVKLNNFDVNLLVVDRTLQKLEKKYLL